MPPAVHFRSAVALAGRFPALSGVDLTVDPGEVVVVLGPNGAGKTSLLRTCAGLLTISSGQASVSGATCGRITPRSAGGWASWATPPPLRRAVGGRERPVRRPRRPPPARPGGPGPGPPGPGGAAGPHPWDACRPANGAGWPWPPGGPGTRALAARRAARRAGRRRPPTAGRTGRRGHRGRRGGAADLPRARPGGPPGRPRGDHGRGPGRPRRPGGRRPAIRAVPPEDAHVA